MDFSKHEIPIWLGGPKRGGPCGAPGSSESGQSIQPRSSSLQCPRAGVAQAHTAQLSVASQSQANSSNDDDVGTLTSPLSQQHPPTMSPRMSLFSVEAVLILGTEDGARILTKYYSSPHNTGAGKIQTPVILPCLSEVGDKVPTIIGTTLNLIDSI